MANFDIPNEEELQPYTEHNYDLVEQNYPIEENNTHSTYDQFISLRDTLVYSDKYYKWKWGSKLIVWEKERTVEIIWRNAFKMSFEPDWSTSRQISLESIWPYVEYDQETADLKWVISCVIQRDGRYRIVHKEEILPTAQQTKVYCYVDIIRDWQYLVKWWVAVFDRQASGTLTWSTSWTDPNGSCSVSFTLWKIFQKITAFWYNERDLKKWDILVLRMKDQDVDANGNPQWNDLTLQNYSNFMSVEYIDLPTNN